jgi:hypothetical protein
LTGFAVLLEQIKLLKEHGKDDYLKHLVLSVAAKDIEVPNLQSLQWPVSFAH